MKVLQFICSTGFYGAERWVLALAKHLPNTIISELAVTLEPGTEDLELVKHFNTLGKTHAVPMKGRFDRSVVSKLAQLIKDNNIDIIHTHGYKSDIIGVLAARKAGIPCVVTPHGFENAADIKLRLFIWAGCQAMRFADSVAPLSPQLVEDVKKFNIGKDKLTYIQNGVDLSEVEAVRQTKTPKDPSGIKTIGFVGQMISRKNITALLDTFESLYAKRQDIRLVLLGDGDARPSLEDYTSGLSSKTAIEFLGFRQDRLEQLRDFDLFVMSSTLEGIPRCLMEACAMEIPVSAYDIAGIDQLITNKDTGLLAPLHNKEQLLADWECLLNDESYAKTLAHNAKLFVEKHFSAQRMADEYATLFNQLLEQKAGN
ncbi:glycosyltransferase [Alteromonas sp. 5E99-2]|uniref:glycosyltransferase n=1 Tax=Alteromonas sp. 5E99-2 TaxID=2817683 RepID=UPI001A9830E3|nr:glycosyltransferase [Alteromonas sp. 5E99-2]MBO1256536.1 glycosyltransferase [Alteromonas sp. 5E99-2]